MSHREPQEVAALSVDDLDVERREVRTTRLASVLGRIGRFFTISGVVTLLFVAFQLWGTGFQEAQAQAGLRDDFAERLAQVAEVTEANALVNPTTPVPTTATAALDEAPSTTVVNSVVNSDVNADLNAEPTRSAVSTTTTLHPSILPLLYPEGGEEVARIEIPSIDVDKIVVEGVNVDDLRKGPGLYRRTSRPGEAGNSAIAGHRTTYGAPFHNIDNLAPGDEIFVTSLLGQFTYRVVGQPEVDRVGFCREEGRTNNEELAAEASLLRAPAIEQEAFNASTTTTTTTLVPQEVPADFAVGAIDGITYFSTTDVESE
ncbi:MAG: sortase, partial [Acidimicrobiales bacterium]